MGRRSSVHAAVLLRRRRAARHRAATDGRSAPLPRSVRGPRHELRRVPGRLDVRDARGRVAQSRDRPRLRRCRPVAELRRVLLRERRDPRGGGGRDRRLPLPARGASRAVLRAVAHALDLRVHELGPAGRGVRDVGNARLHRATGHRLGGGARARSRHEGLPGTARDPVRDRTLPRTTARGGDEARVGHGGDVARRQPPVHAARDLRLVGVLPVQLPATPRLGQPVVRRL